VGGSELNHLDGGDGSKKKVESVNLLRNVTRLFPQWRDKGVEGGRGKILGARLTPAGISKWHAQVARCSGCHHIWGALGCPNVQMSKILLGGKKFSGNLKM
jgi:hypothetical protein